VYMYVGMCRDNLRSFFYLESRNLLFGTQEDLQKMPIEFVYHGHGVKVVAVKSRSMQVICL